MPSKIIDCFIFYNELDMLKLRLKLLYPVVDYFVLCEATRTFRGNLKPLYYSENRHLFKEYADKIIYVVDDELTELAQTDNAKVWENEVHQRKHMVKGLDLLHGKICDADYIIVSDLDELPSPEKLMDLKRSDDAEVFLTLVMDMYYYNLESKHTGFWSLPKMIQYGPFNEVFKIDMSWVRRTYSPNVVADAGWHLSYFGDVAFIQNKLANFSHQEYNSPEYTSTDAILEKMQSGGDLFGRDDVKFERIPVEENQRLHPAIIQHYMRC